MESYKEKMKRKVIESKLRRDIQLIKHEKIGNAIMAMMAILGGVAATITFAFIIYKWLI